MSSKLSGLFGGGDDKNDDVKADVSDATTKLAGLFGGADGEAAKASAHDFVKRVQTGAPHEGFSHEEALGQLAKAAKVASPEQIERATRQAVSNMSESDRSDFAKMLNERMGGVDRSNSGAAAGGSSVDDITNMLGGILGGGGGGDLGGLLGGLLGGASGGSGGGGLGGVLGGLLGGGGTSGSTGAVQGGSDGGGLDDLIGGIFGSTAGKAALGGIAAMVLKEIMDGN